MIVRPRVHLQRNGTHVGCERTGDQDGSRPGVFVSHDDPRSPVEKVRVGSARAAALATRHRMGTNVARCSLGRTLGPQTGKYVGDDGILDRRDVGHDRLGETQQGLNDDPIGNVRWRCDDDETRSLITRLIGTAGLAPNTGLREDVGEGISRAHVRGQAQGCGRGVLKIDGHSPGAQSETKRRAEQARSDDEDRSNSRNGALGHRPARGAHRPTQS